MQGKLKLMHILVDIEQYVHHCVCVCVGVWVYLHCNITKCFDNCGCLSLIISVNIVAQV